MASGIVPVALFATMSMFWLGVSIGPTMKLPLASISSARRRWAHSETPLPQNVLESSLFLTHHKSFFVSEVYLMEQTGKLPFDETSVQ